jgi:ABC-2 type transport system permease protein
MKKYLSIYGESLRIATASATAYRANFVLSNLIALLNNIAFPLVTLLIYRSGATFRDWSIYEVLLIQSVFTLATGTANMLFDGIVWSTMQHVVDGTLDIILIKPVDCMFFLLASAFNINSLLMVGGGGVLMVIACTHLEAPSLLACLQALALFLTGLLVMLGMELLMAATSFKWIANSRIPEIFGSLLMFGNYPLTIFPRWISVVSSFILPVALVGFYPAAALLGRTIPGAYLYVLPGALFLFISMKVYQKMVRLYESSGG